MSEKLQINCPHCSQVYAMTAEQLAKFGGRTTNCKKCGQAFAVPVLEPAGEPVAGGGDLGAGEAVAVETSPASATPATDADLYDVAMDPAPMLPALPPQPSQTVAMAPAAPAGPSVPSLRRPAPAGVFNFADFANMRQLVTRRYLPVVFWVGTAGCVIQAFRIIYELATMPKMVHMPPEYMGQQVGSAIGLVILGPLLWRVLCEAVEMLFRIHEKLGAESEQR